jgi:hypothetical protein
MSEDPSDKGVVLCIIQLCVEGMLVTTLPRIHPHSYLSLVEWLDAVADKGLEELHAHQPTSYQPLDDLMQGLKPVEVFLGHTIPPFGSRDGAATREHGEQRIGVVPKKEPYFLPPDRRVEHQKVYGSTAGSDRRRMSTLPNTAASMSVPYCSPVRKK